MHLDEFQQKLEDLELLEDYNQTTAKHYLERVESNLRNLKSMQNMFPIERAKFYSNYVEEDFIPTILLFLCQLSEVCDINLNEVARTMTRENMKEEYRPE